MSSSPRKLARIKVDGKTKIIERCLLSAEEKNKLDSSPYGIVTLDHDPSAPVAPPPSAPLSSALDPPPSLLPIPEKSTIETQTQVIVENKGIQIIPQQLETVPEKKKKIQDEMDRSLGAAMRNLRFLELDSIVMGEGDKEKDVKIVVSLVQQLQELKRQLGPNANGTCFSNCNKLASILSGISLTSVERKLGEGVKDTRERDFMKKNKKKKSVLELITEEEQKEINDHIQSCYKSDTNFTLTTLLIDLKEKINFRYKRSTLYKILQAMGIVYKLKTYNPMASERIDLIAWRARYLKRMRELRERGAYICYFDETWIFHGMTRRFGWVFKQKTAAELARMGSLKNPIPGFKAASDKGIRAVVLAVLTESGILPESIDVVTSKRPVEEQLVDYHKNMDGASYKQYMEKVIPAIKAATPAGRTPVLVIDNASIHNQPILKLPTKSSTKPVLIEFLESQNITVSPTLKQEELWLEADLYISAHGGRAAMMKYEVDEMAKAHGVEILRLPPYHCCLNPIEMIWSQLKSHLRANGKVDSKIAAVRQQAIDFLRNINEGIVANTIEHVVDVERDLVTIMEADLEDMDLYDSDEEEL
ncbi:hypothetical protein CAEBREN_16193 [Caenorhabditis brenneri]|uniref:Tc1-like transposase DDE domain-containing protein n=1 Tax=Caenorhabditis brenneri TaxID=135651 RepID=G0P290_CAEBE|nr:hypothetical protein CAEBREN_16193 [Caenorhabditis brenneri]